MIYTEFVMSPGGGGGRTGVSPGWPDGPRPTWEERSG